MSDNLSISNVSMRFRGLVAVDSVSLEVRPGTVHAVIGPNGAGKSTLLNVVTGVYRPTAGKVTFGDAVLTRLAPHRIAACGVSRTFQNTELFTDLTARDNVLIGLHRHIDYGLPAALLGLPRFWRAERAALRKADHLLDLVGLSAEAGTRAGTLALGQQRRLELARALAAEPRILLLDEPGGGLRAHETDALIQLLLRLREEFGLTMVLVDHVMRIVMRVSTRITVLNQGRILAEGTPAEIRDDPRVIEAYLGRRRNG
jgi:branched-chain amino acid transport system ATP-binding protein